MNRFERTELLIGKEGLEKLNKTHIIVFGVGGVGGYVVESLVRSGVGKITVIDNDTVSLTNLNRQIIATENVIGKNKVDVIKERILSINPNCIVNTYNLFIDDKNIDEISFDTVDYVVDAVDTITAKIAIIKKSRELNIPIISSLAILSPFSNCT